MLTEGQAFARCEPDRAVFTRCDADTALLEHTLAGYGLHRVEEL